MENPQNKLRQELGLELNQKPKSILQILLNAILGLRTRSKNRGI